MTISTSRDRRTLTVAHRARRFREARVALFLLLVTGASDPLHAQDAPCNAVSDVKVGGPTVGKVGTTYTFNAAAVPESATTPISYTWQATGQPAAINHTDRRITDSVDLSWSSEGTHVVTVTAVNECGVVTSNMHTITIEAAPPVCNALEKATIEGPASGATGSAVALTAKLSPETANTPITYTWIGTGLDSPVVHQSKNLQDSVSLTWPAPGAYVVTLTAANECGVVVNSTHNITIETPVVVCNPLNSLSLAGPSTTGIGKACAFSATAGPKTATTPILYTWRATGQPSAVVHPGQGVTDSLTLTWTEPGAQTVTVTAVNECGVVVTRRQEVAVEAGQPLCYALSDVGVSGPLSGTTQISYAFTATVNPIEATTPITFTWKADGQTPPTVHAGDTITDTVAFSWDKPGKYSIAVTALNECGVVVRKSTAIAVDGPAVPAAAPATQAASPAPAEPQCVPPAAMTIEGPLTAAAGEPCKFAAFADPPATTMPVTFVWKADGQEAAIVHTNKEPTDTAVFTWSESGTYLITITAANQCGGEVSETHIITIEVPESSGAG
ncbi:MAG: PKD domain-containing protein [Acidobacteriota bacterium]